MFIGDGEEMILPIKKDEKNDNLFATYITNDDTRMCR